jgi:two-component system sensor histidine kinase ChiS
MLLLFQSLNIAEAQIFRTVFEYLSTKDGLPQNHVFCINQDSDGFMWFGTMGGLAKYDGFQFTNYIFLEEDSTTISGNFVNRFFQDSKGRCWVSTTNGFNELNRKTGTFRRIYHNPEDKHSLGHNNTHGIAEDVFGNIWVVHQNGVDCMDPKTGHYTHFFHQTFGVDRHTGDILIDSKNNIWVVGIKGVYKVERESKNLRFIGLPSIQADVALVGKDIFEDSFGNIWVGYNRGLSIFDPVHETFEPIYPEHINKDVLQVIEYPKGILAIGTAGQGLLVLNIAQRKIVNYFRYAADDPQGLAGDWVYSLFVDKEKNLWMGLFYGLNRINMYYSRFGLLQHGKGINNYKNFTLLVYQDRKGAFWINTMAGLFYRRTADSEPIEILPKPLFAEGYNDVTALADNSFGKVAMYLHHSGVIIYDYSTHTFEKIAGEDLVKSGYPHRIYFDKRNDSALWFGKAEGLCRLNIVSKDTFWIKPENRNNQLQNNSIDRLYMADDGTLYFVNSGNLCRYDPIRDSLELFSPKDKIIGRPSSVYAHENFIWISTNRRVYCFDKSKNSWNIIKRNDTNTDLSASALQVDRDGNAWTMIGEEISRINPYTQAVNHYQSPTGVVWGIGTRTAEGMILFGGDNGTVFINPAHGWSDNTPPKVVFRGLFVANKQVKNTLENEYLDTLEVQYEDKSFTLHFAALHFHNREKIKYRYRLLGFTEEWSPATEKREVTYTNLAPGTYQFEVIAENEDGIKSTDPLRLVLKIDPPFYLTFSFFLMCFCILLLSAWFVYRSRMRTLELKRKKELAEKSAEYKSLFLANMSHEIRTPMNAMIGLNNLLLDTPLNDKQKEYVRAIKSSGENLLWIVNDILDQAKIESGTYSILSRPFDLEMVLKQLSTLFSLRAEEKKLIFDIQTNAKMPTWIIGDQVRLFQILTNLLGNAFKFTEKGTVQLLICAELIDNEKYRFSFSVSDTGIGIPNDQLERIFESFQQAENQKDKIYSGTGLGLSIVKSLVNQLNGSLQLNSTPGKGSVFTVTLDFLPATPPEQKSVLVENKVKLPENARILLVEDTPFNQLLATELLKKYMPDVEIDLAENGLIGLEKASKNYYDLILMDVKMPVMDGIEATRKIRSLELERLASTPILGLTANAINQQVALCIEAGMDACITKPIQQEELLENLRKYLCNDQ